MTIVRLGANVVSSSPAARQFFFISIIIIIIIIIKHHSHSSPAGAELDSNPTAAAPGQTEVTDLNSSDHSTTSKEMVAWRALVRIHLTRTQDPTPQYTMV